MLLCAGVIPCYFVLVGVSRCVGWFVVVAQHGNMLGRIWARGECVNSQNLQNKRQRFYLVRLRGIPNYLIHIFAVQTCPACCKVWTDLYALEISCFIISANLIIIITCSLLSATSPFGLAGWRGRRGLDQLLDDRAKSPVLQIIIKLVPALISMACKSNRTGTEPTLVLKYKIQKDTT